MKSSFFAMSLALGLLSETSYGAITALNDTQAVFNEGTFLLPDLKSPKDSYLVIIEPTPPGEAVKLALPPGTTGIRVASAALPTGQWTWKYKLSSDTVAPLHIATLQNLEIRLSDLVEGKYSVTWTPVPGAKRYVLTGQARTRTSADDDPPWGKLEVSCLASICARGAQGTKAIDLKAGSEVTWQVSAVDEDGILLARSNQAHIQVATTWVQAASKAGFKLQRSDTLSQTTEPAAQI